MDITLHTAYLTQLVSPAEICRALKTEDSSLCLLRIKGLKGLLGGRPGHGTPHNTGVTKQRPQADRAHTGATTSAGAQPSITHLLGMRRNRRFSSCSCWTCWASCAVSSPVRLCADTNWMFSRSEGWTDRQRRSRRA